MIRYVAVHHAGGFRNEPLAKTSHLQLRDVELTHQRRWPDFKSSMGYFTGYNMVIFPDGSWVQTRAIGEETAAQRGFNHNTISACLIGNFTKDVERPTFQQHLVLKNLIEACVDGKKALENFGLKVIDDVAIVPTNIHPHRWYAPKGYTECYGTGLRDDYLTSIVVDHLKRKLNTYKTLARLYIKLLSLIKQREVKRLASGVNDRDAGCYV